MKKVVLPLLLLCLTSASVSAQENAQETTSSNGYNKWSIDVSGGVNKPTEPLNPAYTIKAANFFHADLGFRYMFNTKTGLKFIAGYDTWGNKDNSPEFEGKMISLGIQGFANLGRIMEFETWTNRLNVMGHLGFGVSQVTNDRFDGEDNMGNFNLGFLAQFRITDRIALNADLTLNNYFLMHRTWDGTDYDQTAANGFDGSMYTAQIGLSFYLGKNEQHADWFVDTKSDELEELEKRLADMETMMNDSDKDGVPDYLDAEPNSITGVAVDSKGRTIDRNGNGVPDELETYIDQRTGGANGAGGANASVAELINEGYVNVYFDFNKDQPNAQSVNGINFLIKYLKDNPSASADVIGYADEIGDSAYNRDLSSRRAQNVRQILIDAGIDGGRLNIVGNGEDNSVNKDNRYARQVVRRVTFKLK